MSRPSMKLWRNLWIFWKLVITLPDSSTKKTMSALVTLAHAADKGKDQIVFNSIYLMLNDHHVILLEM